MILALAASMLSFFQGEVARQSQAVGLPSPPPVEVSQWRADYKPWAWVEDCAPGFECANRIFIREDVLQLMGYDTMRVLALHEVLHVKYGDNRGLSEKQMRRQHERIWKEIDKRLDADCRRAARAEANWWRRSWASR